MTDNEIIKALEYCVGKEHRCNICPCYDNDEGLCKGLDHFDLYQFINRQKAEIENLNKDLADTIALNYEERKGLKAEVERLQGELETTRAYLHDNGLEWDLLSYSKRNGG